MMMVMGEGERSMVWRFFPLLVLLLFWQKDFFLSFANILPFFLFFPLPFARSIGKEKPSNGHRLGQKIALVGFFLQKMSLPVVVE